MSAPMLSMPTVVAFHEARRQFMTAYFTLLWRRTGGNISQMARLAGIGRAHVRRYLKDLAIAPASRTPAHLEESGVHATVETVPVSEALRAS